MTKAFLSWVKADPVYHCTTLAILGFVVPLGAGILGLLAALAFFVARSVWVWATL